MLYFDHNATAPILPEAARAWIEANAKFIGNPSSPHRVGTRAETALNQARETLAAFLGCGPLDIAWTSGATESNNLALHHFASTLPPDAPVWVSAIEHPSVLETARHYFPNRLQLVPCDRTGLVDLNWLEKNLPGNRPGLLALMAANNETGILQPWPEARDLCRRWNVPFFCDAVQWIGKMPASGLGQCDFVSGTAHKFGGPKGVGFLKCPAGKVQPLLRGGPQEEGRRAGTENVPGVLSMLAALEAREQQLAAGEQQLPLEWRRQFEQRLSDLLPGSEVVGNGPRLWNTLSALMPQADCQQRWVVKLDKAGFAVSTGSACSSGREKPSHVLEAMGYSPSESSRVLRFSGGWETKSQDWTALLDALVEIDRGLQAWR